MNLRRLTGSVAAVVMTVAAGLVPALVASPAHAAACSGTTGITVVVDYGDLGDGIRTGCDAGGGGTRASEIFPAAGFPLTYASRSQGFVCRVTGAPASDPCTDAPPATAYWSLWWSDGKSGTWTYSSRGASALRVPDGGYVAFAWHEGAGRAGVPGVAPTVRVAPAPTPTAKPTKKPSDKPTKKPDAKPTPSATPRASESASPDDEASASEEPTSTESATPSDSASPSATVDPADPTATVDPSAPSVDEITAGPPEDGVADSAKSDDDDGLPVWIPILAVVLVAAAGAVAVVRRRTG